MYRSFSKPPIPPPAQTPRHLTFVKKIGQIPRDVASLDSQMLHPLELQRGSNRLFKCTYSVKKQLAPVWINNRPEQKSRGCFTANIYI